MVPTLLDILASWIRIRIVMTHHQKSNGLQGTYPAESIALLWEKKISGTFVPKLHDGEEVALLKEISRFAISI